MSASLQTTTIATVASQTSMTLTAGSPDDDSYNGQTAIFTDQTTTTQKAVCKIVDYVGSSRTITLLAAPVFTVAVGDSIEIIAAPIQGGPVSQKEVSSSNTAQLTAESSEGLSATLHRAFYVGESDDIAVDFSRPLAERCDRLAQITSVAIRTGDSGGLTLSLLGVDGKQAKVNVLANAVNTTPSSGSPYVVQVKVETDQGRNLIGEVTIDVVAAS